MHPAVTIKQQEALQYAASRSKKLAHEAMPVLDAICSRNNITSEQIALALGSIAQNAHVALHFHPDRLTPIGLTVAQSLLHYGNFRNQFETGISNGALTPFAGGIRDNWELQLFGGVYQEQGIHVSDRPKYGALDLANHPDGPAPRFGSCYFWLSPSVSGYCTFSEKDSYYEPAICGTAQHFEGILTELLLRVEKGEQVLGIHGLTVNRFIDRLTNLDKNKINNSAAFGRTLDDYIEAQIHCSIDLHNNVAALVADPSFKNTATGEQLAAICHKYDIALDWHAGFVVRPENIHPAFRGERVVQLAHRIQEDGHITAELIGRAARSVNQQPHLWHNWNNKEDTLQQLKQLWHCLVQFGQPYTH